MSSLVEEALRKQIERTDRVLAMRKWLDDLDEELGPLTEEEIKEIDDRWEANTIHVRPTGPKPDLSQ